MQREGANSRKRVLVRVVCECNHGERTLYYVCTSIVQAIRHASNKYEQIRKLNASAIGEPIILEDKRNV